MKKFLVICILFINNFTFSQKGVFNEFIHLSISEGLSQSSVIAIEQDQFGQMWIGTRDGLNKYDGERITVYKNSGSDPASISNNDILAIKEDKDGYIWIGTHKGLNKYDPKQETFKVYLHSEQQGSIADNTIFSIVESKNGDLWFGTANGLMRYHKEKDIFTTYRSDITDDNSLSSNTIVDIHQDAAGTLWIGTSSGLNKAIPKNTNEMSFQRIIDDNGLLSRVFIQDIDSDKEGTLWIGTKTKGVVTYQNDLNIATVFDQQASGEKVNKDVRSLVFDPKGDLWIATYDGLYIKEKNKELIKVVHQPGIKKSLSRNTLKEVFIDKKGSVWIGAYYGGVNIWDTYNSNFLNVYKKNNDRAEVLGVVSSIVEDKEGNLYFGTEGKGITVIDKNGNTNIEMSNALNKELFDTNVKSLLIDEEYLWIGTFNRGVFAFNTKTMLFDNKLIYGSYNFGLEETSIYSILKEGNNLYLGSFGKGLIIRNIKSNGLVAIRHNPSDKNSLTNNNIRVLLRDRESNLWIGTEYGINQIVTNHVISNNTAVKRFLFNQQEQSGEDILCIFEDYKGSIYVGTKENGLFKFVENQFKPVEIPLSNLEISSIYGIVEDNNFNLWMSCDQGIIKFDPNRKQAVLYNQNDGFMGNEFKNNACIKKSNGDIYFGSATGASYFDPLSIEKNEFVPQVIITELRVQGQKLENYQNNPIIDKSISFVDKIVLPHNKSSFSINFAVPNFINSFNNKYAYRMIGLDDEWKYGNNNQITYTIQNAGTYTFEVLGANNDNVWNTTPTRLEFTIQPSPWRSPMAFLGYSLAIALALFGFNRINKAKTELKHKLELEHLENMRQEEINQSKLQFFTNISHEFRTPLALILGPLQQLLENYQGSNKMYKKLLVIERNADQLLKLINQILDFRKFENEHSKLSAAEGNLVKFLKEIYLSFQEFAKISGYTYEFTTPSDEVRVYFDRNKLEKVFFNLLSNAFKNTSNNGRVELKIKEERDQVVIEVIDNGKGIDKEFVDKVFDRFYEIAADQEYQKQFNQGSGIGLSIAKKAVQLHKGVIEVESVKNEGTTFRVFLKKGSAHLAEEEIIKDFKISDDIEQYKEQLIGTSVLEGLDFESLSSDEEKPTILIAEDNDELRRFIADTLKEYYTIVEAENGAVAFKKALQKSPDLIISDVIMPEMEGTELCAKIKGDIRTSHIPLILLTSRTSLVYKVDGLESGADAYISKPFNVKEFLLTIRNLLSSVEKLKKRFSSDSYNSEEFTVTSIDEELLKKAIKIVEENISNSSFDIPFFSSELGVSRTMLFTKIKGWTNLTPNEFIHSIRMKRASQLLELGEINVSEVCYKVGFRNPKYFTKCFKKHFNQTPTEYASKFY